MKKCVRLAILTALICIFGSHGLVHAEIVSPGGKRDGERFTETIMLEGMEETVRFEHTINDELGIEMDYDYESLDRFSESDCERFISSYDDPEEPQNYLEVRYSAENVDTICAIISMFHEVRCTMDVDLPEDAGYLHTYYNQMITDEPGRVYTVLPAVEGQGRYMGTHLGFRVKAENGLEWQHGHFDFSIDSEKPNLLTATLDDYCGSSWNYDCVYHHVEWYSVAYYYLDHP